MTSLCPFSACSSAPPAVSYTSTRMPDATTTRVPAGLNARSHTTFDVLPSRRGVSTSHCSAESIAAAGPREGAVSNDQFLEIQFW